MKKTIVKLLLGCALLGSWLCLTGAMFWEGSVQLDVETYPIYCGYSVTEIQENEVVKTALLQSPGVLTGGILIKRSADGSLITLRGDEEGGAASASRQTIQVDIPQDRRAQVKNLTMGSHLVLCGVAKKPLGFSGGIRMQVRDIWEMENRFSGGKICWMKRGDTYEAYESSKMTSVSLHKGAVTYQISNIWSQRQQLLEGKEYLEGYDYVLNEIPDDDGKVHNNVERLLVFYFQNEEGLKYAGDKNKTRRIESSIVRNIMKEDPKLKFCTRKTFAGYGTEFTYYTDVFKDKNNVKHNVEFVFIPDGCDGILTMVYMYDDPVHREEILYMMHTIKTNI